MKIAVAATVLCLTVVAVAAANQRKGCAERGGECKSVERGDQTTCPGGVRKLDCSGSDRCCLAKGDRNQAGGGKHGNKEEINDKKKKTDGQRSGNARPPSRGEGRGPKKGDRNGGRKADGQGNGNGGDRPRNGRKPNQSPEKPRDGKPRNGRKPNQSPERPKNGRKPNQNDQGGRGDRPRGGKRLNKNGKNPKQEVSEEGSNDKGGEGGEEAGESSDNKPPKRAGNKGGSNRQASCRVKKQCQQLKGKCQSASSTCRGTSYTGNNFCLGSCSCCVKKNQLCRPKNKCKKKNGTCQFKWDSCDGQKLKRACKGSSSACVCCAPRSCKDKNNQCSAAGGSCVLKGGTCAGQVDSSLCGKFCQCCLDVPTTKPPTTTTVITHDPPFITVPPTTPFTTPFTTTTSTVKTTFITHDPLFSTPFTTTTSTVKTTFITHDPPFVTTPPTTHNGTTTGANSTTRPSTSSNTSVPGTNITTNASITAPNATTTARTNATTSAYSANVTTNSSTALNATTTVGANSTTSTPSSNATSVANGTSVPVIKRLFCDEECGRSTVTVPRIVGGQDAILNEYPWMVNLNIDANGFVSPATCGASIIKKSWILTAAHCVVDPNTMTLFRNLTVEATFAEYDVSNDTETASFTVAPKYVFVHPQYKKGLNAQDSEDNDIALLYLDGNLTFGTTVKPLCMPRPEDYVAEKQVVATGWGTTSHNGQTSNTLKEVALNLKSPQNCTTLNQNAPETYIITDNMICALGNNKDTCQGDSGGPLITQSDDGRWVQLGVVSFGYRCAEPNVPGFYTKLSNYVNWIENVTLSSGC